ncbi:hypothetical protein [Planktothricoides raciborskii]|uniref:Uncharacterized protein n=1 Tax=Planktothricoides raciborskii FACHB-1370 TaxID=2949576 RepID=A0ABR8EC34_9CYAN|nr:hypothetical protein [Planktothricoides raciborskii]MBD2543704.1 hypothetical protein [Planktothricoides raciborskii FACHB-1370]MBD2582403.1 hypothetical protein [Planktothricoides raciborskii FACHB-1261]
MNFAHPTLMGKTLPTLLLVGWAKSCPPYINEFCPPYINGENFAHLTTGRVGKILPTLH